MVLASGQFEALVHEVSLTSHLVVQRLEHEGACEACNLC